MAVLTPPNRRVAEVRGLAHEYFEAGSGAPILYLHPGRGLHGASPFLDGLAHHGRVIAPSHPGFGESQLPPWMTTVEDLAYHYLDFLDALDLRGVTLVGSSFGGWLAASLAIKPTTRIRRLVLIDPVGAKFGGRDDRDIVDIWARTRADLNTLTFHDPAKAAIDYAALSEEELNIHARNRESEALFGWSPYMHDPKLVRRLHRIIAPTLVLWGDSDGIVTPDYGRAYAAAIPGARFELVAAAGHLPHIEQPDACASAIVNFIEATSPRL
ncbi:MAG: alpha/beta hydrolase [Beijerinckiaceae bacterium]|nr:alpha/beta hydrolase [Beijerinckiaceae bacterium]